MRKRGAPHSWYGDCTALGGGKAANMSALGTPTQPSHSGALLPDSPVCVNDLNGSSTFSNKSPSKINFNVFN